MTAYGAVHLAVGSFCAFIAIVHMVLWLFVRPDRAQLWGVMAFLGFAAMDFGIAGSSKLSGVQPAGYAILLGMAGGTSLWWAPLLATWGLLGRPITDRRRLFLSVVLALSSLRLADISLFVATHPGATWEDAYSGPGTWLHGAVRIIVLVTTGVLVRDAISGVRRRNRAGYAIAAGGIPCVLLLLWEALVTTGAIHGVSVIGFVGIPFLVSTSGVILLRYVTAIRERTIAGDHGGYRLIRALAAGGMGELFLAAKTGPGGFVRHVALKRVITSSETSNETLERLLVEARIAARLAHPNVIAVHDVGRLDPRDGRGWFIAMEYLPGVDLARLRDRSEETSQPLPVEFVVAVGEQIARGLGGAHAMGIVHRDVSPHNAMVTFDGAVKVIDFGIARDASELESEDRAGKGPYVAPERFLGAPATPASDVFSLGVTLFELLAGRRPFAGAPREIRTRILRGDRPKLSALRPGIPRALESIVDRALSAEPARRFADGEAMALALARVRDDLPLIDLGRYVREHCGGEWDQQRSQTFSVEAEFTPTAQSPLMEGDRREIDVLRAEPTRPRRAIA